MVGIVLSLYMLWYIYDLGSGSDTLFFFEWPANYFRIMFTQINL